MKTIDQDTIRTMTDSDWRARLDELSYYVLRQKGTERAFTGIYTDTETAGTYHCKGCHAPLFSSTAKFHSGCGWPSFDATIADSAVEEHLDTSHGMRRVEVTCSNCGGHLGHVFPDGPKDTTGMRYCINSLSIDLESK